MHVLSSKPVVYDKSKRSVLPLCITNIILIQTFITAKNNGKKILACKIILVFRQKTIIAILKVSSNCQKI